MKKSFLLVNEQPLIVRLALLFCRRQVEERPGNWTAVYKSLNGKHYLVEAYHRTRKCQRRFVIFKN